MPSLGWLRGLFGRVVGTDGRRSRGSEGGQSGNGNGGNGAEGLIHADNFAGLLVPSSEPPITEEELSGLDHREREMLRSIIELDYTTVREVMVPRLDMVAIEADVSLHEAAATIVKYGHSRIPVYEENIDYVLGIIYVRDLLAAIADPGTESTVRSLTRPAFIIPETKRVDELLEELRERHIQIAIVVDEYGGTEGLVTMEDVLEEIVGEIEDEFSRVHEAEITHDDMGAVIVSAGLSTEDVKDLFGVSIDSEDFATVGGFVYHQLGRIPHVGDVVESGELRVEVATVAGRRLRTLKITKQVDGPTGDSG